MLHSEKQYHTIQHFMCLLDNKVNTLGFALVGVCCNAPGGYSGLAGSQISACLKKKKSSSNLSSDLSIEKINYRIKKS